MSSGSSIPGTQPISEGVLTVSGTVLTATKFQNGDILVANQTVHPDTTPSTTPSPAGFNGTASAKNGSVGDCYASWIDYWSASQASYDASLSQNDLTTVATSIWLVTGSQIDSGHPAATSTAVTEIHTVKNIVNGGFTISTQTVDTTSSTIITQSSYAGTTEVYTNTNTEYNTSTVEVTKVPPKPTCSLPSVVPDCQSSWEAFITSRLVPSPTPPPHCDINAGFLANTNSVAPCASSYSAVEESYYSKYEGTVGFQTPLCTAASIGGPLCQTVRDKYQLDGAFRPGIADAGAAFFFNQGTIGLYNGNTTSWVWPTSSTMGQAPSCTLGCGRCAVTGGTVQLMYWPATATQSNNVAAKASPTPPPIVTVETLGTTFTSPTLYISYKSLYAANACGTIGKEIGETILAIPPDNPLSSVYAGTVPCDAHFRPTQVWTATAPFTVEDLYNDPVPYSIYSSQPWCQTYAREHACTETCPTTAPYKPILVVNNDLLRGLQDDWTDCWGDIRGVYDPPLALTEAKTENKPMNTFGALAQPATPATGPAPNTAVPTAAPDNAPVSVNGEPVPSVPKQPDSPSPQKSDAPAPKPEQSQGATPNASPDAPRPEQSGVPSPNASPNVPSPSDHQQDPSPPAPSPTGNPQDHPQDHPQEPSPPAPSLSDPQPKVVQADPQAISLSPVAQPSAVQVVNQDHSAILTAGGPAVTVGSQIMSAGPSGNIIVGTGQDASTVNAGQAPNGMSFSPVTDHQSAIQVVNGDHTATLTPGASAVTVGSQIMSAGSSGAIVVGTGQDASTIDAVQAPTAATFHAQAYTMSELSGDSSAVQVVNGGKTETLTPGGPAVTVGSQVLSAASSGRVVVGTGSSASTVDVVQTSSMGSSSSTSGTSSTRSSTTTGDRPTGTTAAAASSSSAGSRRILASSGLGVVVLLFGILAL